MMKSRSILPPGGWKFLEPKTGWTAQFGWTFSQCAREIQKHRLANPRIERPTDINAIEEELDSFNAKRMESIRGGFNYVSDSASKKVRSHPLRSAARVVAKAAVGAKRRSVGIKTIIGWLGTSAAPVSGRIAESRAARCCDIGGGKPCPQNKQGDWTTMIPSGVAEMVRQTLEAKEEMALRTSKDSQLGTCNACLCYLPLKVWAPTAVIKESTSQEIRDELDSRCWVLTEIDK